MVAAADLKAYQAANMPEDDTSTVGGAINTNGLVEFTQMAASDTLEALSDNAADTMNLTITGRNTGGAIDSQTLAMNGTTVVSFTTTLERLLKAVLATGPVGNVTIRRSGAGATVATIPAGKTSVRRLFYDSASEVGATVRYEKVFFKNEHGVDTLSNAKINLSADPTATIEVGCAPSKGDTATATNRKTAPASVVFVDDGIDQSIPTSNLAAGESIGVWAKMSLGAGAAAIKSTFTLDLAGTSP